ncbi:hypothetical protein TWF730_006887 [Orbilia blumenaviensis]|uniref:Protein SQS1 n=1 Tax=Orbilia blumenaviensis TaxID=1796055 RepID=A0AAV9VGU1_9PEZI
MPRRKPSRPSPSHKNHGSNNRFANRHSHASPPTPTNGRRGKAQRLLLLGNDFDLDSYDSPSASGHHGFTLQQEARNTEERYFRRNDDRKLRQLGITFVRPQQTDDPDGDTTASIPTIPPNPPQETSHSSLPSLPSGAAPAGDFRPTTDTSPPSQAGSPRACVLPKADSDSHSKPQDESPAGEEEEVVFVPRNQRRPNKTPAESQYCKVQPAAPTKLASLETLPSKKSKASRKTPKDSRRSDDDDEIIADYIKNLEDNGEDIESLFALRPLGSHFDDIDLGDEAASHQKEQSPGQLDTENEEPEIYVDVHIAAVIGRRNGESGIEYHFKPAGSTVKEALWLEGTDMTRDIQHLIDHFEAGLDDKDGFSSTPEDSDGQEDIDQELARMLRLEGHDEDEDEDDEDDEEDDDDDDDDFDAEDLINMMLGKPSKQGKFPSASKLADAYDDFDIMSRERASLSGSSNRKSRKANLGRPSKGHRNTGADDEEAEIYIELEKYILADREKKKSRKQERDARRQAGTLSASNISINSGSMDIKGYPGGTTLSKVHASIKQFLMSGVAERLSLPPMQKQERAQIHTLAHKFYMQSRSQGKGNGRFPVLYKTKRTRHFEGDEEMIDDLLNRSAGRGSHGNFRNVHGKAGRQLGGGGGGGRDRATHNEEGMIVGTGAAELSQGNKGYDMLAKMGWTTGTGLGSNRSGILDPVQAIVKNSRAGLG